MIKFFVVMFIKIDHVCFRHRVRLLGLQQYEVAIALRDAIRQELLESAYNFLDLVCLICVGDV